MRFKSKRGFAAFFQRSLRSQLLDAALLIGMISGCGASNLSGKDRPSPHKKPDSNPETPLAPETAAPTLEGARLVRRISLDITGRLPSTTDVDLLKEHPTQFAPLVDAYLASGLSGQTLSLLHSRIWHHRSDRLPDLDQFIAAGDSTLGSQLTTSARLLMLEEPTAYVRWSIDRQRPFSEIFTLPFGLGHKDLINIWQAADDGSVFPGENWRFLTFTGERPAAGILTSPAFLALNGSQAQPSARAAKILSEFLCLDTESINAHRLTTLAAADFAGDLLSYAAGRPACAGCHLLFDSSASALSSIAHGSDFTTWLTYVPPTSPINGNYAGRTFADLTELAALMGVDPRVHLCEVSKLANAFLQRQVTNQDQGLLSETMDEFYRNGRTVVAAARPLIKSAAYAVAPLGPKVKGKSLAESGVRLLGRRQWLGILQDLAPYGTFVIRDDLDPGQDEFATQDDHVPSGNYWHATELLARQAAEQIVDFELADGCPQAQRRVLPLLPDGAGQTSDDTLVEKQMQQTWRLLTSIDLQSDSPDFVTMMALWTSLKVSNSASDSRRAWRVVLTAMLIHPSFLTY